MKKKSKKINSIEDKLIKIFTTIFKIKIKNKILNLKKRNFEKWDSLNHIKLIIYIENEFKIKLGTNKFNAVDSFKKIFNVIKKKKTK